jgi:hypothetical protein
MYFHFVVFGTKNNEYYLFSKLSEFKSSIDKSFCLSIIKILYISSRRDEI